MFYLNDCKIGINKKFEEFANTFMMVVIVLSLKYLQNFRSWLILGLWCLCEQKKNVKIRTADVNQVIIFLSINEYRNPFL